MAKIRSSNSAHYVPTERLRIGLYVHLDLPWFQHPFTLNSFHITSEEQIRALVALGEPRFRYDPERSLTPPDSLPPASPAQPDGLAEPFAEAPEEPADALSGKQERVRMLAARRRRIEQVNKAFLKSTGILRNLSRNLTNNPKETLQEMGALVEKMVQAFLEHPEATLHLMGEECGGEEIYSHSLNVSVLSMMLAKGLDFSPEQARVLGLGALLHDIGLMDVPDRLLKMRPDEFTRPEREMRAMHCEYGVRLGKQLGLPADILAIIYQHHEMADGSGYPLGIRHDRISLPVRIVALVNCYDTLCNPVDFAQAMTPHEALSFLFGQRRSRFDGVVLQRMIRCLGVYPPGSIVTLSNDAIAMVVSVNTARPLRPWVMVYDERTPKEEAILLDLERENTIMITGGVRPALLQPAIAAYLSPRRRVTYFFDSNTQSPQESL